MRERIFVFFFFIYRKQHVSNHFFVFCQKKTNERVGGGGFWLDLGASAVYVCMFLKGGGWVVALDDPTSCTYPFGALGPKLSD